MASGLPVSKVLAALHTAAKAHTNFYNVVAVSPSLRENSTWEQAVANFGSDDMKRLGQSASQLPSVRHVQPAFGTWKDGAEESNLVHFDTNDFDRLRFYSAVLAKAHRQKGAVWFTQASAGPDTAHVLRLPTLDPRAAHRIIKAAGPEFMTLVKSNDGNAIMAHVLDQGNGFRKNLEGLARKVKTPLHTFPGSMGYIGDDDRERAQAVYNQVIQEHANK